MSVFGKSAGGLFGGGIFGGPLGSQKAGAAQGQSVIGVGQGGAGGASYGPGVYIAWIKAIAERSVDDWLKHEITTQDILKFPNAKIAAEIKKSPLFESLK